MKQLFLLFICSMLYNSSIAQIEKVILKHSATQPRWVLTCDNDKDENCRLIVYFRDGRQKATARVIYHDTRNRFRPNGNAVVYYENGSIHQEYNHSTGELLTYYPTGELEARMITPINEDMEYKYRYFKNGQTWEEEVSKREIGKQNLAFGHSGQRDYFYDNTGYSYNYYKTYHSNGNVKSHTFIDENAPHLKYVYQYFLPDGRLDPNAIYDKVSGRMMKNGRRYGYHSNGQLRQIVHYENDKISGERQLWTSSGVLIEKGNYKSGSRHGKYESWWENGQIKEWSFHLGYYKHGPILRWHRDGRVLEQGSYYQGKALGIATIWDTLGKVTSEHAGTIEVQQYNAYYKEQNINDKTYWYRYEGNFVNGLRDGKWKFYYDKKGKDRQPMNGLCTVLHYKNGVLDGKVIFYHPNGEVLLKTHFQNGWLEGNYIAKQETGEPIIEGVFNQHKKNGKWTRYHHKSYNLYSIRGYENNVQTEVYKEWEMDGFLKYDRIDNKAKKQVEYYTYYKSGMKTMSAKPYGWTNMHYYEYDDAGFLKKERILNGDNGKAYTQTEYYSNGQQSSASMIVDNKREGIYWAWYENGTIKSQIPFEDGKRHGISHSWDEFGKQSTKLFENGIEVIQNTFEEEALKCSCNHPPKEVRNRFMNWFLSYAPYEDIKERTDYFTISEKSYKRLFSKSIHQYDNRISGTLAVINDFYVEVHNGLRLDFTACRRGVNRTTIDINADYNEKRDVAALAVKNFDLSIEFPQNLLRLYDIKTKTPLVTNIQKFQKSSLRYEVDKLEYTDKGNIPTVVLIEKRGTSPCFQISEIGTTGILFDGSNPVVDLSPKAYPRAFVHRFQAIGNKKGYLSDHSQYYLAPSWNDLNSFMGVCFQEGQLYIPYQGKEVVVSAKNVFIDGQEIHGNIKISKSDHPSIDINALIDFLGTKGFEILNTQFDDDDSLYVFWKYVGK